MRIVSERQLKTIAILGFGRSGKAVLDACIEGALTVCIHDDRIQKTQPPPGIDPALFCDYNDWDWQQLDALVISPGIPHLHPQPHPAAKRAADEGVEVISEIEFALRRGRAGRWVSITGTNGKSTTTALIGHILETAGIDCAVGGNIGTALTSLAPVSADGVNVIELSSYQLEITPSLRSDIAVILNITPDHLDRHGGMDGYVAAKQRVIMSGTAGALVVLGAGPHLDRLAGYVADSCQLVRLTAADTAAEAKQHSTAGNMALRGLHNAENCLTARLVCRHLGVAEAVIDAGIAGFAGLPHRMQPAGHIDNILFVNDSKATNGEAAGKALASYHNIHWCAGGQAKADGLQACLGQLSHVRAGYLYGEAAEQFARSLSGQIPVSCHDSLDEAVRAATISATQHAAADSKEGAMQVILLSPAAASFDQFSDYEARGRAFCALAAQEIERLKTCQAGTDRKARHV